MIQYGVAVLEKGTTILCGQRLVLNHLANSEPVNITLKEYYGMGTCLIKDSATDPADDSVVSWASLRR